MIPTRTTPRLTLRPLSVDDFDAVAAFYASGRSKFVGGPMNAETAWRALASEIGHWSMRGYGRWAVDVTQTGTFVGIIGLWNPLGWPEPELGWDLFAGHKGKGDATQAATTAQHFGLNALIGLIDPDNMASQAVAKCMGAVHEPDTTILDHPCKVRHQPMLEAA